MPTMRVRLYPSSEADIGRPLQPTNALLENLIALAERETDNVAPGLRMVGERGDGDGSHPAGLR